MRYLLILLTVCWLGVSAAAETSNGEAWRGLAGEAAAAGMDPERFQALVGRCRAAGLSAEATRGIAAPLMEACRRRLPTEPVLAKIDEGLAKGVNAERITRAAGVRIARLEEAGKLVDAHRGDDQRGRPGLVAATALALESSVSEEALAGLLSHPGSKRPGWLMAAIEGMETLHAQDFPDAEAQRLMQDALTRGLRRYQILQGVDIALQQFRSGTAPAEITLVATPSGRPGRPDRPGRGGGNGGPPPGRR